MSDRLRDRIAAVVKLHDIETGECGCDPQDWWLHVADAVIAELNREDGPTEPARLQARLDNIGRWLHPGLWSGMDGRRGIFLRILAGEQIEPPESARSTDWKADDES